MHKTVALNCLNCEKGHFLISRTPYPLKGGVESKPFRIGKGL